MLLFAACALLLGLIQAEDVVVEENVDNPSFIEDMKEDLPNDANSTETIESGASRGELSIEKELEPEDEPQFDNDMILTLVHPGQLSEIAKMVMEIRMAQLKDDMLIRHLLEEIEDQKDVIFDLKTLISRYREENEDKDKTIKDQLKVVDKQGEPEPAGEEQF